jgi:hypothetical protein
MARRRRNAWHDFVMDAYSTAEQAWLLAREAVCIGYATEESEYDVPRPTLKATLQGLAGSTVPA